MGITCLVIVVKQFEGLLRNARTARTGMNAKVKGNEYLESYTVYILIITTYRKQGSEEGPFLGRSFAPFLQLCLGLFAVVLAIKGKVISCRGTLSEYCAEKPEHHRWNVQSYSKWICPNHSGLGVSDSISLELLPQVFSTSSPNHLPQVTSKHNQI